MRIRATRNDEGATAVEYAMIVALIAAAITVSVMFMGRSVAQAFTGAGGELQSTARQGDGLCSSMWFEDPAPTCAGTTGEVDVNSCAAGQSLVGDGTQANPYACLTDTAAADDATTECEQGYTLLDGTCVPDDLVAATPTATESATPAPTPTETQTPAPTAYAGPTPSGEDVSRNMGNGQTYALPSISGIHYTVVRCEDSGNSGCSHYTLSGSSVTVDSRWSSRHRQAELTIGWTIPETAATLATSGSFKLKLT